MGSNENRDCIGVGLTERERDFMEAVLDMHRHDMAFVPGRTNRREIGRRLAARGLLRDVECVKCDGDGWALEPERWASGYELTDLGLSTFRPEALR
jgi:hypothetical protein